MHRVQSCGLLLPMFHGLCMCLSICLLHISMSCANRVPFKLELARTSWGTDSQGKGQFPAMFLPCDAFFRQIL